MRLPWQDFLLGFIPTNPPIQTLKAAFQQSSQDPLFGYRHADFVQRLHSEKNLAYKYDGNATLEYSFNGQKGKTEVETDIKQIDLPSDLDTDAIFFPSNDQYIERAYDRLQNHRDSIEASEAHFEVADFLNQSIGDKYTELYLETLEIRNKPVDSKPYWINIKDLGTGLVRTIPIFLAIGHYQPWMFLWDDMGTSLHPGLLQRVIKWLADSDSQIIASTHSIDLLSALLDVRPENTTILQLSKGEDDILRHKQLDLEDLELMMDNAGHDPRYIAESMEI